MGSSVALGIDLGTSFCCAAIYRNRQVEIVPNGIGLRVTPSVVAFNGKKWFVGEAASKFGARNPDKCVYEVKRLMGRSFLDPKLKQLKHAWPFEVVAGPSGGARVEVPGVSGKEVLEPEEISAMLLKEMKKIAETFAGGVTIEDAVITVPAYFNDSQREATKKAGTLAGLHVLRLMNEPTAAAAACGYQRLMGKACAGKKVMVLDLGGETLDVSIIAVKEGAKEECGFEVLAVEGESRLGGADFDNGLMMHVAAEYERQTKQSITTDHRVRAALRQAVITAKHSLSFEDQVDIELEKGGVEFSMSIDRSTFESLNEDLFRKCIDVVEKALRESNIRKHDISQVVLAGGSTRIPRVQELLTKFLEGRRPLQTVHPDEVVAYGAAVQAGLLAPGLRDKDRPTIALEDITALSIGVKTEVDAMSVIIPEGSRIPAKGSKRYRLPTDFQTEAESKIYEGERVLCRNNRYLGVLHQKGFRPSLANGRTVSEVALEVNSDGILCVKVEATANHVDVGSKVECRTVLGKDDALAGAVTSEPDPDWEEDKLLDATFTSRRKVLFLENHFQNMSKAQKAEIVPGESFPRGWWNEVIERFPWLEQCPWPNKPAQALITCMKPESMDVIKLMWDSGAFPNFFEMIGFSYLASMAMAWDRDGGSFREEVEKLGDPRCNEDTRVGGRMVVQPTGRLVWNRERRNDLTFLHMKYTSRAMEAFSVRRLVLGVLRRLVGEDVEQRLEKVVFGWTLRAMIKAGLNHIPLRAFDIDEALFELNGLLDRLIMVSNDIASMGEHQRWRFKKLVLDKARSKMNGYINKHMFISAEPISQTSTRREIDFLTERFLVVPTDKSANTPSFVCANFIRVLALHRLQGEDFVLQQEDPEHIIPAIKEELTHLPALPVPRDALPYLMAVYKAHKQSFRWITNTANTVVSPMTDLCACLLRFLTPSVQSYCSEMSRTMEAEYDVKPNLWWPISSVGEFAANLPQTIHVIHTADIMTY
ncbi:hypothetical protein CBR_g40692 [Chara braunii]|uniref:Uncharacterized protein n=1 Tax=Chara braunii TaxID=69332 RepID=A0A388LU87_CHABU|nr:hypothetical protein CBR_g40692 [Chara braunii]|eukprot:GBG85880.1 hypothetical protein CBR_g40692 [Chara braunii]